MPRTSPSYMSPGRVLPLTCSSLQVRGRAQPCGPEAERAAVLTAILRGAVRAGRCGPVRVRVRGRRPAAAVTPGQRGGDRPSAAGLPRSACELLIVQLSFVRGEVCLYAMINFYLFNTEVCRGVRARRPCPQSHSCDTLRADPGAQPRGHGDTHRSRSQRGYSCLDGPSLTPQPPCVHVVTLGRCKALGTQRDTAASSWGWHGHSA